MPKHHHPKIESFLIHLVAVLFLFSTLSAAFLGYGVYQSDKNAAFKIAPPAIAADPGTWEQTSWAGEESTEVYNIQWGLTGGWNKYASGSGVTVGSSGFTIENGGEIISSIFYSGTQYRAIIFLPYTSGTPAIYFRGGQTAAEVNSAGWQNWLEGDNYCNPPSWAYSQYKFGNESGSPWTADYVLVFSAPTTFHGTVRDASTGNPIPGATLDYGSGSTTTSSNGTYQFTIRYIPSKSLDFKVSKSGYDLLTKPFTLPGNFCSDAENIYQDFNLSPSSGSSSTQAPSQSSQSTTNQTSKTTSQTQSPSVSLSTFQDTKLPTIFTAPGSTTTDLSKVADPKKVENFTLDIPGKNKIVFNEALDLSSEKTVEALKQLDGYVKINSTGAVELDTTVLSVLNKKATITMYNLTYLSAPEILVDGEKDTKGIISNIKYDPKTGTLTFDVVHFTTFTAVPKLELLTPTSKVVDRSDIMISIRVSDPDADVTGELNGTKLTAVKSSKQVGVFSFVKFKLKEGENKLKVSAESKLGKVLPLVKTITYNPSTTGSKDTGTSLSDYSGLIVVLLVALAFAVLLGYLIYKKKLRIKLGGSDTYNPPQPPQNQTGR